MKSGHVSLFKIFDFVSSHPRIVAGGSKKLRDRKESRDYAHLCKELTKSIPRESGWYFWGRFDKNSGWECIYVGKSERTRKGSLHDRILSELLKERIAFWSSVVGRKKAFADLRIAFKGKYDKNARRAIRKKDTHFIIWVSDPKVLTREIRAEEKNLIYYYEPLSNQEMGENRFKKKTKEICKFVKREWKKILDIR